MDTTKEHFKYQELRPSLILATLKRLEKRIGERFPNAGLRHVSKELTDLANEMEEVATELKKPNWTIRISAFLVIGLIISALIPIVIMSFSLDTGAEGLKDWIETIESGVNDLIFIALTMYFFFTMEIRIKRRKALKALYRLRSMAHVLDMHQLTKDPAYILADLLPTESSPERTMTAFELTRYLNYCTELLSLISKLAALFAQNLNDDVVLNAVNDVESLAGDLSAKIWQKLMILDLAGPEK